MANSKDGKKEKHSGFEANPKFEILPKGYTKKRNRDGTVTLIPPRKNGKKES